MEHHDRVREGRVLPDAAGYGKPVGGVHVGAVLGHEVDDGDVVLEAHQVGTGPQQLFSREAGLKALLRFDGCDGAARGQKRDFHG